MDGDLEKFAAPARVAPVPGEPASRPTRPPERIAALYRRIVAARGAKVALPDLAGCYDYDL